MTGDQPISWLMFVTLASAIIVAAGAFLMFLRPKRNRDIAADALAESGITTLGSTPRGALPELLGLAAIAVLAMGLLTAGYASKSSFERRQVGAAIERTTGMAQPAGTANQPKTYQPANPAPDLRAAPTSSDTGSGAANGSTGSPK